MHNKNGVLCERKRVMKFIDYPKPKTFDDAILHISNGGEVWVEHHESERDEDVTCYLSGLAEVVGWRRTQPADDEILSRMHLVTIESDRNDIPTFNVGDEVKVVRQKPDTVPILQKFMGQKGVVTQICERAGMSAFVRFDSTEVGHSAFYPEELELVPYVPLEINKEKMELLVYRRLVSTCLDPDPDGILAELVWDDYFGEQDSMLDDTDDLIASKVFNEILTRLSQVMLDALKPSRLQYICDHPLGDGAEHCPLLEGEPPTDFPLYCAGECEWCKKEVTDESS
jgi:hypothetical protein